MGCISPTTSFDNYKYADAQAVNDQIDEKFRAMRSIRNQIEQYKYRILLLGTEGSGKSTLFKQMRMLHGRLFDQYEFEGIKYQLINMGLN